MRTANRNIAFIHKAMEQINNNIDTVQAAIQRVGTPKDIDAYFDKFTIAFGKWLLQRTERTLEHSVEELLAMYRDYIHAAPDEEQVDYKPRTFHEKAITTWDNNSKWCESCQGRNCIC